MYSKIFILTTRKDIEEENFGLPFSEDTVCTTLNIDYVVKENPDEMEESVKWLEETYNIKCKPEKIGEHTAYKVPLTDLIKSLEKEKLKRIKAIREILNNKDPEHIDLWEIAYEAYNRHGFFFVYDHEIGNSVELLGDLKLALKDNYPFPEYIIETYDYHY